jgi:hypothetical protein
MSKLSLSDLVWATWLLLFLTLEIPAAVGHAPWNTFSETSWIDEQLYPILKTLLFGFLIGLAVHSRFGTGLFRTTIGGTLIALVLNYLW